MLSGPSHAEEVRKQPTTVAASSINKVVTQDLFMNDYLRVYTNDLIGVELGGALKNIIAVASGIVAGIGCGN